MAYNTGVFTVLNQNPTVSSISADSKIPIFSPPVNFFYAAVYGQSVAPTIRTIGTGAVLTAYAQQIAPLISSSTTVSNAYGLNLVGPAVNAGTLTSAYSLFVSPPTLTAGTIINNYTAFFALPTTGGTTGGVGIGTTTPRNALDVAGSMAVGLFAGKSTVSPTGSLAISGGGLGLTSAVGIGTSSPQYLLDIFGTLNAGAAYGWMASGNNQNLLLAEGLGLGDLVGTNRTMSRNTTFVFDTAANVQSNSRGFGGALFDGRYVYFIPYNAGTYSGQITRFDTRLPFGSSSSYVVFNTATVSSLSMGFSGGAFDGRYIYLVPNQFGVLTQYDTTIPFGFTTSYAVFNLSTIQPNNLGFNGAVFDGQYLYLVPEFNAFFSASGQIVQYNTLSAFSSSNSYAVFDTTANVNSNSRGFFGGVFDGQYVYLVPNFNGLTNFGQITRYDTTLSFTSAASYAVFDTTTVSAASVGFLGGIYDGRFVYLIPGINGQITRYDTTGSFTSSASYSVQNTALLNSNSFGFLGAVFDGRYISFVPNRANSGQITRYDATQFFLNATSYTFFDTTTVQSLSQGFAGGVYDGQYIYLAPFANSVSYSGQITRLSGYPGPNPNVISANASANAFAIGSYAGVTVPSSGNLIVSGSVGIGTSSPQYTLDVQGSVSAQYVYGVMPQQPNQTISLAQGYNQGGFGGGSVGTQKTMSANTSVTFSIGTLINSNCAMFGGALFDGRYVYFVPLANGSSQSAGVLARYDTTLFFSASASYSTFDMQQVNTQSLGFNGSIFDGRYAYFVPANGASPGQITRYDTSNPFSLVSSYAVFNTATLNPASIDFNGAIFDGRYIYFVPQGSQITQYDTTLPFTSSSSYAFFDTSIVQSNSINFAGGTFDGRYVYFTPAGVNSGQITRYDSTLSFSISTSYLVFDTQTVNTNSKMFYSAVFDGRFVHFVPLGNGQITRYDTYGSFASSSSYAVFDLAANINSLCSSFEGAMFDGRYIYYAPSGISTTTPITRYDTTQSFLNGTSYSTLSNPGGTAGYAGGIFDGRYIYFALHMNLTTGLVTRIDAYPGPAASAIVASSLPTSFAIGNYAGINTPPSGGLIVSGSVGIGTSSPNYQVDVAGSVNAQYIYDLMPQENNQNITLAQGYNQGGGEAGSVGTNKLINTNTAQIFNLTTVNSQSVGFNGAVFDGRYVYLMSGSNGLNIGLITRYDTLLSFSTSTSYSIFSTQSLNSNSIGYDGIFDGRYLYCIPGGNGLITRYDTNLSFVNSNSYSFFNTTNLQSNSFGFNGAIFDGRYIYCVPYLAGGQITRYDTTLSFTNSSSYTFFDMQANVNSLATGLNSGTFDGRYVYMMPNLNSFIVSYDTTLSFTNGASYSLSAVSVSTGVNGATFDGRYVYSNYAPNTSIGRYDTYSSFSQSSSYTVYSGPPTFPGFVGQCFDGRYAYFAPNSGAIICYDTTLIFSSSASYSSLIPNVTTLNYQGALFDGKYVYFIPFQDSIASFSGQLVRVPAYPGPQATAIAASGAPNGFSVGTYAGNILPPTGGMIVSGAVGVNIASPSYPLDVNGVIDSQVVYGYMPQAQNQLIQLAEGYDQGGFGGGSVGTNKTMSAATTVVFDMGTFVNSNSVGFFGCAFDGRYLYCVPSDNRLTVSGQITRYDTIFSFSASTSYAFFDTAANVNSKSVSFIGGVFDGRYVYLVPNSSRTTPSGQITRYDTTLSFSNSTSYSIFDMTTVQTNSKGFIGGVFDGRYIYYVPNANTAAFGLVVRFDTTLQFTSTTSYAVFDMAANINSNSAGFSTGLYDGRYIYFVPNTNNSSYFGQITRYDTTLSFLTSTSYSVFDTTTVQTNSKRFGDGVFDGKYLYFIPMQTASGQITRYDTTLSFSTSTSYSVFDTTTVQSLSTGFQTAVFDGRYIYLCPFNNSTFFGQVTRYDVTLPFGLTSSYQAFDTASVQSNSVGFRSSMFDGRYIYLIPRMNPLTLSGQMTRIDAYPGPFTAGISSAYQAANTFMLGTGITNATTLGTASIGGNTLPIRPQGYLILNINGTPQKIPYYN
jgi:hypothetical protein